MSRYNEDVTLGIVGFNEEAVRLIERVFGDYYDGEVDWDTLRDYVERVIDEVCELREWHRDAE